MITSVTKDGIPKEASFFVFCLILSADIYGDRILQHHPYNKIMRNTRMKSRTLCWCNTCTDMTFWKPTQLFIPLNLFIYILLWCKQINGSFREMKMIHLAMKWVNFFSIKSISTGFLVSTIEPAQLPEYSIIDRQQESPYKK